MGSLMVNESRTAAQLSPRDPVAWIASHLDLVKRLREKTERLLAAHNCLLPSDDYEREFLGRAIENTVARRVRVEADIVQVRRQMQMDAMPKDTDIDPSDWTPNGMDRREYDDIEHERERLERALKGQR